MIMIVSYLITTQKRKNVKHLFSDRRELIHNVRLISNDIITVSEEGKIYGNWVCPDKCRSRT
jgi:hypothetical protein